MSYLVTGVKPLIGNSAGSTGRIHNLFDTEEEAKKAAEKAIIDNCNDVAVWALVGQPKVEKVVKW